MGHLLGAPPPAATTRLVSEPVRQTWVTVREIAIAPLDPSLAGFAVDSPRPGDHSRGVGIEINGWAISRAAPVQAITVTTHGNSAISFPLDVRRPDVANDYPDIPHPERSGFSVWAPLELTGDGDAREITVAAVLSDRQPVILARIVATIRTEDVIDVAGSRRIDAPDFAIVGTQRGGTTSLHAYLGAHPQIRLPATKELHYLTDRHHRGREWYLGQFPSPLSAGHRTGEATPYALFHPLAPARLRSAAPDAKLIVLLRNPVDRAYSHFLMERQRGDEPLDFAAALAAEPARLDGEEARMLANPTSVSWPHKHASYLARGDYAPQLARWFAAFPRQQFLILRSEDLYTQPAETFARVTDFLGLDRSSAASFPIYNRTEGPPLDPTLRRQLIDHFASRNAELATLLGWDPNWP